MEINRYCDFFDFLYTYVFIEKYRVVEKNSFFEAKHIQHPLDIIAARVIVHGRYPSVFRIQSKKCLNATMTALLPPSGFFFFLLHSLLAVFCLQCQGFVLRASLYHGSDHIPQAVRLAAKDERTPKDEEAGDEGMSALEAKLAQLRAMTDRIETNLQDDDDEESDDVVLRTFSVSLLK